MSNNRNKVITPLTLNLIKLLKKLLQCLGNTPFRFWLWVRMDCGVRLRIREFLNPTSLFILTYPKFVIYFQNQMSILMKIYFVFKRIYEWI